MSESKTDEMEEKYGGLTDEEYIRRTRAEFVLAQCEKALRVLLPLGDEVDEAIDEVHHLWASFTDVACPGENEHYRMPPDVVEMQRERRKRLGHA